jgi:hypothetical protein
MLADVQSVQDFLGAADATEAKADIWYEESPKSSTLPQIVISRTGGYRVETTGVGEATMASGSYTLELLHPVDPDYLRDNQNAVIEAENAFGPLFEGSGSLFTLTGDGGRLDIASVEQVGGMFRTPESDEPSEGDYYRIEIEVVWQ